MKTKHFFPSRFKKGEKKSFERKKNRWKCEKKFLCLSRDSIFNLKKFYSSATIVKTKTNFCHPGISYFSFRTDRGVVGSIPAQCWAFFSFYPQ